MRRLGRRQLRGVGPDRPVLVVQVQFGEHFGQLEVGQFGHAVQRPRLFEQVGGAGNDLRLALGFTRQLRHRLAI